MDAYWDGGQNIPFGPVALNDWSVHVTRTQTHPFNALLGDHEHLQRQPAAVVVTGSAPKGPANGYGPIDHRTDRGWAKVYVLNPRNGRWAATDILETGVGTADFVSVICIDLANVYTCVPTLGVLPGDTVLAFYQDPSNHSDSAMDLDQGWDWRRRDASWAGLDDQVHRCVGEPGGELHGRGYGLREGCGPKPRRCGEPARCGEDRNGDVRPRSS